MVKPKFCISSLLAESARVMKSKLLPNVIKGSSGVLNIFYYSLTGWYWTPDIHNPNRKIAALGVKEGERGEPKNKQRIKRPKQNWAVRRPIVTKRSTANANTEKSIPHIILQAQEIQCCALSRIRFLCAACFCWSGRLCWSARWAKQQRAPMYCNIVLHNYLLVFTLLVFLPSSPKTSCL